MKRHSDHSNSCKGKHLVGADLEIIIAGNIEACGRHGAKEVALDFYI